jgi:hypothetical protein
MTTAVAEKKPVTGWKAREMRFVTLTPFVEANGVGVDTVTRKAKCIIITEGLGNLRDKNYYTAEAIESAAAVFRGKQFYIDHPSESEESDRPERSIYDLAGWFGECTLGYVPDPATGQRLRACFSDLEFDTTEAGSTAMGKVEAALKYQKQFPQSKDVYAGISINGGGISHPGTIRGMQVNLVTEIQEAFSADIVTKPARGGRFLALIQEAARAAAWTRSQTQKRREASPRTGAGGGRYMATAVAKEAGKKDPTKVVVDPKKAKEALQLAASKETMILFREVKALKRSIREAASQDNLEAVVEVATEKLKAAGAKFAKAKAGADKAGVDVADILMDIQQDIGELSKELGLGGGAEEVPEEVPEGDMPAEEIPEGEDAGAMGAGDPEMVAAEGEEETEGKEKEGEEEAEGGEQEAEGSEQEGKAAEGEDAEKEAFGDDEDADDDEGGDGDMGMGDEAEAGQRMQYKCAKCSTVNEVAPPEGFTLARTGETMGESERQLRGRITMIERQLEAKEGRFVKTNRNLSQALKENQKLAIENRRLKSKVIAFDRLEEAGKLLKEANVPADILSAKELVTLYEPEQWPSAIKQASNQIAREAKLMARHLQPVREAGSLEGSGEKGEVTVKDMVGKFTESYQGSDKK